MESPSHTEKVEGQRKSTHDVHHILCKARQVGLFHEVILHKSSHYWRGNTSLLFWRRPCCKRVFLHRNQVSGPTCFLSLCHSPLATEAQAAQCWVILAWSTILVKNGIAWFYPRFPEYWLLQQAKRGVWARMHSGDSMEMAISISMVFAIV